MPRSPRRWWVGGGFLTFHVSLFLCGVVVLLLLNLATAPGDLWVAGVAWPWATLLVIHGLTIALLRLVGLLRGDDVSAASAPHAARAGRPAALPASAATTAAPTWPQAAPHVAATRFGQSSAAASETPSAATAAATAPLPVAGSWAEWAEVVEADAGQRLAAHPTGAPRPDSDPPPPAERVSWEEAGVGAWLSRRGHGAAAATPLRGEKGRSRNGRA